MQTIKLFIRFAAAGAVATLVHYAILVLLTQTSETDPVIASAIGFAISALVNYSLNYRFTFRSRKAHTQALPRFGLVALSGLLLNTGLMALLVYTVELYYLIAQVVTTAAVLFWNFTFNRLWSFGSAN